MRQWERMDRRRFVADLGRGAVAVAVFGVAAACGDGEPSTTGGATPDVTTPPTPEPSGEPDGAPAAFQWERVELGVVSAYLIATRGEVVLVDTGVPGSADQIGAALEGVGSTWADVRDVILTHRHDDHVGSLAAVLDLAIDAQAHMGAEDLDRVSSPRPIAAVADGDVVAGLRIIATPGHTAGHISVLDTVNGVLVAGDALNGGGGRVTGANPQYSSDMTEADRSVRRLAEFEYETALFGHGGPVVGGASAAVAELAASL